jgi:hypothetical protein
MRTILIISAVSFIAGCSEESSLVEESLEPWMQVGTASRSQGLEGVYCTSHEIGGFSGTILELKDGKFRYWFYSDVGGLDEPQYPLTGKYMQKDQVLTLDHPKVNQREWIPGMVNGVPVLWRDDALQHWRKDRKVYDYGVLIKTEGAISADGEIPRPSVKELYGANQRDGTWKDPFIHGPQ